MKWEEGEGRRGGEEKRRRRRIKRRTSERVVFEKINKIGKSLAKIKQYKKKTPNFNKMSSHREI